MCISGFFHDVGRGENKGHEVTDGRINWTGIKDPVLVAQNTRAVEWQNERGQQHHF